MSKETAKQLKRKRELTREAYQRNKDNSICAQGGCARRVKPPHAYCPKCLAKKNARTREWKRKAKAQQRAASVRCLGPDDVPEHRFIPAHKGQRICLACRALRDSRLRAERQEATC